MTTTDCACPVNFEDLKIRVTRTAIPFPKSAFRRASLNSFGYGGSNAHVIVDEPSTSIRGEHIRHVSSYSVGSAGKGLFDDEEDEEEVLGRPRIMVLSANSDHSLKAQIKALRTHLISPAVKVKPEDLAYTLSDRRSHHFQRAYAITRNLKMPEASFVFGKPNEVTKVGLVFTGQGAQWPQMAKSLVEHFPSSLYTFKRLDKALRVLPNAPSWSILGVSCHRNQY